MDHGVIVDLETTGVDPKSDRIVEVGIVEFAVGTAGEGEAKPRVYLVGTYSGLEDPGRPLSPEIAKLTGLSDEVLAGRKVDWEQVRAMLSRATVVVAHNAPFDRAFLEARPELAGLKLHWACSIRHINWLKHGFKTRALNYLAADHGFVNPFAHRALFDCATTFRLVTPYLDELIRRSYLREYLISATGAPFETKDVLRTHGYRWNPEARVWAKSILEDELAEERAFLAADVYKTSTRKHTEEEVRVDTGVVEAD
ncbi:MAG: polymerase polC-type [Pseudomonadota bacterium]|jgi:DNA polymerase-3 subunit epsilon